MKANGAKAADFCQMLIDDFIAFYQGRLDDIQVVNVSSFKNPQPPSVEQMGKMLSVCRIIWKAYCRQNGMPGESQRLLEVKLKKKWKSMERIPIRHRTKKV